MFGVLPTSVRIRHPPGWSHHASESKVDAQNTLYFGKVKRNSGFGSSFSLKIQSLAPSMGAYEDNRAPYRSSLPRAMQQLPAVCATGCGADSPASSGNPVPADSPGTERILHASTPPVILHQPMKTTLSPLLLLVLAVLCLTACQQHPAAQNVPVLEVNH